VRHLVRLLAPSLVALLGFAVPAYAAPEPIVFDFEDGLQGWTLEGSAQRVQTQVLGGQWAIFGDGSVEGGALVSIQMDLSNIAFITVEQFLVDGDEDGLSFFYRIGGRFIVSGPLRLVEPGNPSVRAHDVMFPGDQQIGFYWGVDLGPEERGPIVAFIDNITFHPVPEPSSLAFLGFSLGAILIARRRIK